MSTTVCHTAPVTVTVKDGWVTSGDVNLGHVTEPGVNARIDFYLRTAPVECGFCRRTPWTATPSLTTLAVAALTSRPAPGEAPAEVIALYDDAFNY